MPKKAVTGTDVFADRAGVSALPTWQAGALALAVAGGAVLNGVGTLVAGPILATLIWALTRLHRHAPSSPSTSDLVGSTLGDRAARTSAVIQLVAYALLGANAAMWVGLQVLSGQPDLGATLAGWWWPALSVAALLVAAALVSVLSTRAVASIVAVLAASGLLVFFYAALAVLAKVMSGTPPVQIGTAGWPSALAAGTAVIFLGLAAVGFELPTTTGNRLRSVGRPLGWAVGAAAACAALALLATNLGAPGNFRFDAKELNLIVLEMFGGSAVYWLIGGAGALSSAALLALIWAALRVARRLTGARAVTTVVMLPMLAILTVALCRNWAGVADKLVHVAAMLLVALYAFVAEANSRLPEAGNGALTTRVLWPVVLAAVVLIPLRYADYAAAAVWPVAIAAVVVGIAAALSATAAQRAPQGHPPR